MIQTWLDKITDALLNNRITRYLDQIQVSWLGNISAWQIAKLYVKGIQNGLFNTRVAAISWNLFFGFFPFLLFFFSVLPYLPKYEQIEEYFFTKLLPTIFPPNISTELDDILSSIAKLQSENPDNQVSWYAILISIYFSSNGINSIFSGFASSYHSYKKRSIVAQRLISIGLTILFTLCIGLQFLGIYYISALPAFVENLYFIEGFANQLLVHANHILGFILFWVVTYLLFYFGYPLKKRAKSILISSLISSLLFFASSYWFNLYIANFNRYDIIYGSVGAIMVFMLFIYFNVIFILVGFEFSALLHSLTQKKQDQSNQQKI